MTNYDACEQAYKKGYAAGYKAAAEIFEAKEPAGVVNLLKFNAPDAKLAVCPECGSVIYVEIEKSFNTNDGERENDTQT